MDHINGQYYTVLTRLGVVNWKIDNSEIGSRALSWALSRRTFASTGPRLALWPSNCTFFNHKIYTWKNLRFRSLRFYFVRLELFYETQKIYFTGIQVSVNKLCLCTRCIAPQKTKPGHNQNVGTSGSFTDMY